MNDPGMHDFLQKHFSVQTLERDPALLRKVLGMLRSWLITEGKHPYPSMPFDQLVRSFEDYSIPADGMEVDAFLDELHSSVLSHTAQLNHPMFIGHMTQALPWLTVIAEAFTAALNQNQVKIETAYASTLVEKQILGWMHRRVYQYDDDYYEKGMHAKSPAIGNVVNGGTVGNLTALAVALEQQLPGSRKEGIHSTLSHSGYRGLAVIASVRAHYSLKKSLATMGMGENSLHVIAVDQNNRIDLDALKRKFDELRRDNIKVVALVGVAGTTETGAIDPLQELAEIARQEQTWFHVDAAWGGALLLADQFRPLYQGIEFADSVVIDGHKLMWVPMAQGMILFKHSASLDNLKHNANYIIRSDSGDLGQTSLEGSRRFDALKLWTSFKVLGISGYTKLLTQAANLSATMISLIQNHPDFELTSSSKTFILTYRYAPQHMQQAMKALVDAGNMAEAITLNRKLNDLNAKLQDRQKNDGKSFVSRTILDFFPDPQGVTVLRVVLTNVTTTRAHLETILAEQCQIGSALLAGH